MLQYRVRGSNVICVCIFRIYDLTTSAITQQRPVLAQGLDELDKL